MGVNREGSVTIFQFSQFFKSLISRWILDRIFFASSYNASSPWKGYLRFPFFVLFLNRQQTKQTLFLVFRTKVLSPGRPRCHPPVMFYLDAGGRASPSARMGSTLFTYRSGSSHTGDAVQNWDYIYGNVEREGGMEERQVRGRGEEE